METRSPLGSTPANAFLSVHEVRLLNNTRQYFKPVNYQLYVDDKFLIFKCHDHVPLFSFIIWTRNT